MEVLRPMTADGAPFMPSSLKSFGRTLAGRVQMLATATGPTTQPPILTPDEAAKLRDELLG